MHVFFWMKDEITVPAFGIFGQLASSGLACTEIMC